MKCFKLNDKGDVIIENNIQMVDGDELIRQTCQTVLGTNKREWFLNEDEGINFKNILKKKPNFDLIRNEIRKGLLQVDTTFVINEFEWRLHERFLNVSFTATSSSGVIVKGGRNYGD